MYEDESLEVYYWVGFLLADGCFTDKQMLLTISELDLGHLKKLQSFIGGNIKRRVVLRADGLKRYPVCSVNCNDYIYIPKIKSKFDIKNKKTYNPPGCASLPKDGRAVAMLIGFFDGDGSVAPHNSGRVVSHRSWAKYLLAWTALASKCIQCDDPSININIRRINGDIVRIYLKSDIMKKLKQFIIYNNLPNLERKWDKIDINYISKNDKKHSMIFEIQKHLNENRPAGEIASIMGINNGSAIYYIKKYNLVPRYS